MPRVEVIQGDITRLACDAIVNAANVSAGPALLDECRRLGGCTTGNAKATKGYSLPARWVIHAVGPIWRGGNHGEPALLRSAYVQSLALAESLDAQSVAFPNISTGAYGFPKRDAAEIAISTVRAYMAKSSKISTIIFCCYDHENYSLYQTLLQR